MFGGDPPQIAAPSERVLLRVFVHFYGDMVILLLGGYDKGADSTERRRRERGQASRPKKHKRRD